MALQWNWDDKIGYEICEGWSLSVDGEMGFYENENGGFNRLLQDINITPETMGDYYKMACVNISRDLFSFGTADLSKAYNGHNVVIDVVPCKD